MKKFLSLAVAIMMALCLFSTTAFAASPEEPKVYFNEDGILMIELDNQEQYEEVLAQIQADNAAVEQLWSAAVAESQLPENMPSTTIGPSPRLYTVNEISASYLVISPFGFANIKFSATYDKTTNGAGTDIIGTVYSTDAFGGDGQTSVTMLNSNYTHIDGSRTLAVNYSLKVGLVVDGNATYTSKAFYVEFYASGDARVY